MYTMNPLKENLSTFSTWSVFLQIVLDSTAVTHTNLPIQHNLLFLPGREKRGLNLVKHGAEQSEGMIFDEENGF